MGIWKRENAEWLQSLCEINFEILSVVMVGKIDKILKNNHLKRVCKRQNNSGEEQINSTRNLPRF